MDRLPGPHIACDRHGQRIEQERHTADPVGHRRAIDINAVARIDIALPVQGQMITVFDARTWASRPGPGRPRSIGSEGIGGCVIVSQARQLSFERTCTMALKCEGTYFSTSRASVPITVSFVPPQAGQAHGASCIDTFARQMIGQRFTYREQTLAPRR